MKNDKDIQIESEENVGLHAKVKSGARALDKKIEHQNRDTNSKYEEKKLKRRHYSINYKNSISRHTSINSNSNRIQVYL